MNTHCSLTGQGEDADVEVKPLGENHTLLGHMIIVEPTIKVIVKFRYDPSRVRYVFLPWSKRANATI